MDPAEAVDPEYEARCDNMARAIFVLRNKYAQDGTLCDTPGTIIKKHTRGRYTYPPVWYCCGREFGMRTKKCSKCGKWQDENSDIREARWD